MKGIPVDKTQRLSIPSLREDRLSGKVRRMYHWPTELMAMDALTKVGISGPDQDEERHAECHRDERRRQEGELHRARPREPEGMIVILLCRSARYTVVEAQNPSELITPAQLYYWEDAGSGRRS
eukprot:1951079-Pyramimonas_sp.AAC.1